MAEGTGYEVVPESLADMATEFRAAADSWTTLKDTVGGLTMQPGDLGLLATNVGYVEAYNAACTLVVEKLGEAVKSFDDTEAALVTVANTYAAQDAEYYEQFGYLGSDDD
ncbi:hypothetical protein DL991_33905 [Amycolatopsis sp. WAC 01375]|uniref:hypothetical protein n=1 Tax=unclassified Amycolatopsis TaxID=2618356 RepID=UPI000F7AA442|nr:MULTISPECIES: hypothetical protein [unclassified Amycolatopsis]RSM71956.1 hypothetical protein DL991_33905 [Amycolatopsis sp. WAC 01375]RSN32049.1 hypothetical protein DL990_19155 [Amycolatopsis sp. WAC 01416]